MNRNVMFALAFGSSMVVGVAHAASDYTAWDTNSDGKISFQEWEAGQMKRDSYAKWDTDNDGQISRDEYNRGSYMRFDANKDNNVDENEFNVFSSETDYKFPGNQGSAKGK